MRVNVYAEEMTDRVEVISKTTEDGEFTGLRIYLELPVTRVANDEGEAYRTPRQEKGPFIHRPGDDDSAAVTFWGKKDLCVVLAKAIEMLDAHYAGKDTPKSSLASQVLHDAKGVRVHGSDYRYGTHATILWKLVDSAIKEANKCNM